MVSAGPRAVCYRCDKPAVTCVCDTVPRVDNKTSISVIQHPRERLHPIGTARFLKLGLSQVDVRVAWDAGRVEAAPPAWLPEGAALLYPARDAPNLGELPPCERPQHLVVIDGTWHTARTLYRDKAWLRRLPAYRLFPDAPSRYRIRGEPELSFVSTLEAVALALTVLEPETPGVDALLAAFDRMIDRQLEFIGRGRSGARVRDRRPKLWRRVPRAFAEHFDRLVVTYVESARENPSSERELVQLTAVALKSAATFERLVRPSFGLPSSLHLSHMRLAASDFDGASNRAELASGFREFLTSQGPSPIVSAWSQGTLDLLAEQATIAPSRTSIKAAYRNAHPGTTGDLDAATAHADFDGSGVAFKGRATERTLRAIWIARHLNALAGFDGSESRAIAALALVSDSVRIREDRRANDEEVQARAHSERTREDRKNDP